MRCVRVVCQDGKRVFQLVERSDSGNGYLCLDQITGRVSEAVRYNLSRPHSVVLVQMVYLRQCQSFNNLHKTPTKSGYQTPNVSSVFMNFMFWNGIYGKAELRVRELPVYLRQETSPLCALADEITRKAKKRCDEGLPACSRCVRLGKACGGYRDFSQLMFRDQTASVTRRASALSDSSTSASGSGPITRQLTPEKESRARSFFFHHFVTTSHLIFLEGISPDEFLINSITACGLAALANRENDVAGRGLARRYYVQAISATNSALQHPRRVREDNTLVSIYLLGIFEV